MPDKNIVTSPPVIVAGHVKEALYEIRKYGIWAEGEHGSLWSILGLLMTNAGWIMMKSQ